MNTKFYELSYEKQTRIKNAGYKVFGENTYKKASMKLIADNGNISKSLLFHYFRNKQTLYEYLFKSAMEEIRRAKKEYDLDNADFFDLVEAEIVERFRLMSSYPLQYRFIMKVYDEICYDEKNNIKKYIDQYENIKRDEVLKVVDTTKFRCIEDVEIVYDMIFDLANGYYLKVDKEFWWREGTEVNDFKRYLESLKRNYYKEKMNV